MKETNVRKKEEKKEIKRRKKIFVYTVIALLSLIAVYFLTTQILKITDVVSEGYFRINDFVITSKVDVKEKIDTIESTNDNVDIYEVEIENDINNDMELKLDISQNNKFTILIPNSDKAIVQRVYLSNIKVKDLDKDIYITTDNGKQELNLKENKNVELGFTTKDNQYLIEFELINKNIMEGMSVPDGVDTLVYDGTILKTFNYDTHNLKYRLCAKLNVVDNMERTSVCDIDIGLPVGNLGENGIVIQRENMEKYNLKLRNKILEFLK